MGKEKNVKELRSKLKELNKLDPEKLDGLKAINENYKQMNDNVQKIMQLYFGALGRVHKLEQRMNFVYPMANKADLRSLALMKILHDKEIVNRDNVFETSEAIQIKYFDAENLKDDINKNLVVADDEEVKDGYHAICCIKVFKDQKELIDERMIRTKFHVGANELFPEFDAAVLGMKVGETKTFPLNLKQETDVAEITLISLRKAAPPKEETKA